MLVNTKIAKNDVVSVKLSNGDEIVAKIVEIDANTLIVSKPLLMVLTQDPRTGQPGIQMAPFWLMGSDPQSTYPINRSHTIVVVKANRDVVKNYLSQTTGLEIPGSSASGLIL